MTIKSCVHGFSLIGWAVEAEARPKHIWIGGVCRCWRVLMEPVSPVCLCCAVMCVCCPSALSHRSNQLRRSPWSFTREPQPQRTEFNTDYWALLIYSIADDWKCSYTSIHVQINHYTRFSFRLNPPICYCGKAVKHCITVCTVVIECFSLILIWMCFIPGESRLMDAFDGNL